MQWVFDHLHGDGRAERTFDEARLARDAERGRFLPYRLILVAMVLLLILAGGLMVVSGLETRSPDDRSLAGASPPPPVTPAVPARTPAPAAPVAAPVAAPIPPAPAAPVAGPVAAPIPPAPAAPVAPSVTVRLRFTERDAAHAAILARQLQREGFAVARTVIPASRHRSHGVFYFFPADRENAWRIAGQLAAVTGRRERARLSPRGPGVKPGTVEVSLLGTVRSGRR